jgi:hypothetical protein
VRVRERLRGTGVDPVRLLAGARAIASAVHDLRGLAERGLAEPVVWVIAGRLAGTSPGAGSVGAAVELAEELAADLGSGWERWTAGGVHDDARKADGGGLIAADVLVEARTAVEIDHDSVALGGPDGVRATSLVVAHLVAGSAGAVTVRQMSELVGERLQTLRPALERLHGWARRSHAAAGSDAARVLPRTRNFGDSRPVRTPRSGLAGNGGAQRDGVSRREEVRPAGVGPVAEFYRRLPRNPLSALSLRGGKSPRLGAAERFLAQHPGLVGQVVPPDAGEGVSRRQARVGVMLLKLAADGGLADGFGYLRETDRKVRLARVYRRAGEIVRDGAGGATASVRCIAALPDVMDHAAHGEDLGAAGMIRAFNAVLDLRVEEALEHVASVRGWLQHGGLKGMWLGAGRRLNRGGLIGDDGWLALAKSVVGCG